jgi:Lrp/AsnC family transcriptional regulator
LNLVGNFPMALLDSTDCRILESLQADASQSLENIAKQVNLSPNACWHRIKHLEQDGIILKRVAIVDPAKLGIGVTVFVLVRAGEHSDEWFKNFAATVRAMPEVVEFYRTSGDVDYLLKLQLADIASYDESYKCLIRSTRCADVSALFSMQEIRRTTAVPLPARIHN